MRIRVIPRKMPIAAAETIPDAHNAMLTVPPELRRRGGVGGNGAARRVFVAVMQSIRLKGDDMPIAPGPRHQRDRRGLMCFAR